MHRAFRLTPILTILKQIFNNQKQRMSSEDARVHLGIVLIKYWCIVFQTSIVKKYLTFKRNIIDFHILHSVSSLTGSISISVSLGISHKRQ